MSCEGCGHWIVVKKTIYDDGNEIETFRAGDGEGHCEALNIDTSHDFHCAKFGEGEGQTRVTRKTGMPWTNWMMIDCPDCKGAGSSGDRPDDRCAGTGKVRLYDDGFIGDERTRVHPKEQAVSAKPKCPGCGRDVDRDWVACPACGRRLEAPAKPEVISEPFPAA